MKNTYSKTLRACYLGFITQAIAANFIPLLFLTFHKDYNLSMSNLSFIPFTFFFTQLLVDIICAKIADKTGYRLLMIISEILCALGLILITFLPELCSSKFCGIIICVIIYAIGSGIIETLCSPIVESCPLENKEAHMSLLHSFYCWGTSAVILLSTLFFNYCGIKNWKILSILWTLIPIINIFNFISCPINIKHNTEKPTKIRTLLKNPIFYLSILLMLCAGACELSIAQWASAFTESSLGLNKNTCDLLGPGLFAIMMGISRTFYGKYGSKINLINFMTASAFLCLFCYLITSLSQNNLISLIGCIVCGFSVAIIWPGTLSLSSNNIKTGGTALFALLAMAGDIGSSTGPVLVGTIAQAFNNNIKTGILFGTIFPFILIISLLIYKNVQSKYNKIQNA